jgi:hypothetical protein
VEELVPLSKVHPYPEVFSIKLLLPQAVTNVPDGAVIFPFIPVPVVPALAI